MSQEQRELTFGEKAVGASFNPSKFSQVDNIKRLSAALIDEINNQRLCESCGKSPRGEVIARFTLAQRHVEEACMRAVGAATYQY